MYLLTAILWAWAAGWLYAVKSEWGRFRVTINGRPASPEEAQAFMWGALSLGILIGILGIVALLYLINCRIQVAHGYISWFNWLGRLRVRGSLNGARLTEADGKYAKAYIDTEGGEIAVRPTINDYGVLYRLVTGQGSLENEPPREYTGFVPPETVFRYRWSYLHIFSFLLVGGLAFMIRAALDPATEGREIAPFMLIPFAGIAIWMQLTGWRERIEVGRDGFKWIDWLGRVRVHARLDQVVSSDAVRHMRNSLDEPSSSTVHIHTTVGTIQANSHLRGWRHLMTLAERVARDSSRGTEDLSDLRTAPGGPPSNRW